MNEITLKLSNNDINVLIEGLGQLPLKVSIATFQKLQMQFVEQRGNQPACNNENHSDKEF